MYYTILFLKLNFSFSGMMEKHESGEVPEKKKRKRLKHICAQIREQMEFYFGDANLSKDRFLKRLMDEDPDNYVPIEVFLNFNKMRAITEDVKLIAKALSTSQLVQVNADGTKVKRSTPVVVRENVDECTVYVEGLPACADHDWVKNHFMKFGEVLYVSLPKYKSTGDIKGFAFVEFDTEESAARACENLNADECPEGLGKFPKTNKQIKQLHKKVVAQTEGEGDQMEAQTEEQFESQVETQPEDQIETKKNKRKIEEEEEEQSEVPLKKTKMEFDDQVSNNGETTEKVPTLVDYKSDTKASKSQSHSPAKDENKPSKDDKPPAMEESEKATETGKSADNKSDESKDSKRVRINEEVQVKVTERQKHKRRRQRHRSSSLSEVSKDVPQLKVIPKAQWLKLKSEYLALQKKSMKQLKSAIKSAPKKNRNQHDNKKENNELTFIPNVIVKVEIDKPTDRKDLKERLSGTGDIAYIDFLDGDTVGHIRCSCPEVASRVSVANIRGHSFGVLQGDEEQKYWSKILADRQKKRSSKQRSKKRGPEKIIEKVEVLNRDVSHRQHIVFDD